MSIIAVAFFHWENMSTLTVTKAKPDIALLSSNHVEHAIWNWYYACVYYWLIKTGESRSSSTETALVIALCFPYMRHNKTPTTTILKTKTLSLFNRRYNSLSLGIRVELITCMNYMFTVSKWPLDLRQFTPGHVHIETSFILVSLLLITWFYPKKHDFCVR